MNAGIAAYVILTQNTDVTDIVGVKVFPEVAEQETATPFIVYQLQSVAPEDTHDGPSKLDEVRFEFLCYADTYALAADLGDKVRGALDRVSGTYNGVNVESVQFNDVDIDTIDAPRRFAQVLTFTFRIKRDNFTIAQGTPVTGAKIGDLYDVDVTGVTDGQVLAYDAAVQEWQPVDDAGGVETLEELTDTNIISPSQGSVISYNSGVQKWMVNNGLQELLQKFKASGTGSQMYDTLNDTTKGYIDILASSATMKVNHSGMTISEASPGVLSFSVAAGTEGNEVEFQAMTIEGSDAFSTAANITFKPGALTYWENATGRIWLRVPNAGNLTVLLPSSSGTLALTTDIPNVPVDSVNGQTGIVVLDTGDIDENGNLYYTEARVAANSAVAANTAKVGVIAGGTTGQALVKASGTDYDTEWADIAIDTQYHNRFQTDAETFRSGATETVELYYTAKADGDGLAESASSDTPSAGNVIRRKLYYAEKAQADPDTSGDWTQFADIADDTTFVNAKAALLAYLKERTGGTVPISLKMTWEDVAAATSYLLDDYSGAAAAYSLRLLSSTYAGDAIEVYNGSSYADIGFDGDELDTTALATHCGANDGFVSKWYDQSGNTNTATQATTSQMPKIYDGTTGVVTENGKPAVDFDGSNDAMYAGLISSSTEVSISAVHKNPHKENVDVIIGVGDGNGYALTTKANEYNLFYRAVADQLTTNETHLNDTQSLIFAYTKSATSQILHLNGVEIQNITPAIMIAPTTSTAIGTFDGTSSIRDKFNGQIQEIILWASDQSSNRTGIEDNINTFYSIY